MASIGSGIIAGAQGFAQGIRDNRERKEQIKHDRALLDGFQKLYDSSPELQAAIPEFNAYEVGPQNIRGYMNGMMGAYEMVNRLTNQEFVKTQTNTMKDQVNRSKEFTKALNSGATLEELIRIDPDSANKISQIFSRGLSPNAEKVNEYQARLKAAVRNPSPENLDSLGSTYRVTFSESDRAKSSIGNTELGQELVGEMKAARVPAQNTFVDENDTVYPSYNNSDEARQGFVRGEWEEGDTIMFKGEFKQFSAPADLK
jgi:hypothetical protein